MARGTSAKVAKAAAPVPRSGDVSGPGKGIRVPFAKAAADPRFRKLVNDVQRNAKNARKHPSAAQRAGEAQAASRPPPNERAAAAQADQVDNMDESRPAQAQTGGFLAMLRAEIEKVMPKNLDESTRLMEGGASQQVRGAVSGEVRQTQENAAAPVETAATAAPNEGAVPQRAESAVPADPAAAAAPMSTANAVPPPRTSEAVSQRSYEVSAEQRVRSTEFTDQQIGGMNVPQAQAVTGARGEVRQSVATSEQRYRARENPALARGAAGAGGDGRAGAAQMVAQAGTGRAGVMTRQQAARARDEARRRAVVDHIQGIYNRTKASVERKLETLETDVMAQFDRGSAAAIAEMKRWSDVEIRRFKDRRYSGLDGAARWVIDKFRAVPQEIVDILTQARTRFAVQMDAVAVQISNAVDTRLAETKAEIKKGQAEIATYVAGLDPDLRTVGREAQASVQSQFQELEQSVDAKKQDLANKLAQRYKAAFDAADAALNEIRSANEGALRKLVNKVGEFLAMIAEMKNKLMAALRKGWSLIKRILADPIGFLGNLINAVKGGVMKFVRNFGAWLMRGLIGWLFGALAGAGITLPSDLSLPSILKLVMDILGLTWARIRARAVRLVGEPVVRGVEMLAEFVSIFVRGGPVALWAHIRDQLSGLKEMVIDAIISWVTQTIITQAATRLLSMLNPAGAFVQACIAIYNTVMFFVERAQQIMSFIEAILNSVENIVNGNIGAAVNWIEQSLGRIVPLAISFLARLLGLGGITERIVGIIRRVQGMVERAIDAVLTRVIAVMRRLIARVGGMVRGRDVRTPDERRREMERAVTEIRPVVRRMMQRGVTKRRFRAYLGETKRRYRLAALEMQGSRLVARNSPGVDVDTIPEPSMNQLVQILRTAEEQYLTVVVQQEAQSRQKIDQAVASIADGRTVAHDTLTQDEWAVVFRTLRDRRIPLPNLVAGQVGGGRNEAGERIRLPAQEVTRTEEARRRGPGMLVARIVIRAPNAEEIEAARVSANLPDTAETRAALSRRLLSMTQISVVNATGTMNAYGAFGPKGRGARHIEMRLLRDTAEPGRVHVHLVVNRLWQTIEASTRDPRLQQEMLNERSAGPGNVAAPPGAAQLSDQAHPQSPHRPGAGLAPGTRPAYGRREAVRRMFRRLMTAVGEAQTREALLAQPGGQAIVEVARAFQEWAAANGIASVQAQRVQEMTADERAMTARGDTLAVRLREFLAATAARVGRGT